MSTVIKLECGKISKSFPISPALKSLFEITKTGSEDLISFAHGSDLKLSSPFIKLVKKVTCYANRNVDCAHAMFEELFVFINRVTSSFGRQASSDMVKRLIYVSELVRLLGVRVIELETVNDIDLQSITALESAVNRILISPSSTRADENNKVKSVDSAHEHPNQKCALVSPDNHDSSNEFVNASDNSDSKQIEHPINVSIERTNSVIRQNETSYFETLQSLGLL